MLQCVAALCDNVSSSEYEHALAELYPEKAEEVMPSVLEQWVEQGKHQGSVNMARQAILDVVEERFGTVPGAVSELLSDVTDEQKLRAMLRQAIKAETAEGLARRLKEMA